MFNTFSVSRLVFRRPRLFAPYFFFKASSLLRWLPGSTFNVQRLTRLFSQTPQTKQKQTRILQPPEQSASRLKIDLHSRLLAALENKGWARGHALTLFLQQQGAAELCRDCSRVLQGRLQDCCRPAGPAQMIISTTASPRYPMVPDSLRF